MATIEQRLAELENRMAKLRDYRNVRIGCAKLEITAANREFDIAAVPLGRQINELRDQLEAEQPEPPPTRARATSIRHDPEWSQEDIDHFHELAERANKTRV